MKKTVSVLLCFLLMTGMFITPNVSATSQSTEFFDDGSFICVNFGSPEEWESVDGAESSESNGIIAIIRRIVDFFRGLLEKLFGENEPQTKQQTITRTKYAAYYDSKGTLLWTVYLNAKFTYDGETAECIDVSVSHSIKDSDWKLIYASCEKSKNTAKGSFGVKQYKLGIPLKEIEKVLTITCDKNGNVN